MDSKDIGRKLIRISHEIIENHADISNIVILGIHNRGVPIANRIKENISSVTNIDIPNTQKRGACVYVGAAAGLTSLTVVMESGNTATIKTVSGGTILPILIKRVTSTITTNDVIALY